MIKKNRKKQNIRITKRTFQFKSKNIIVFFAEGGIEEAVKFVKDSKNISAEEKHNFFDTLKSIINHIVDVISKHVTNKGLRSSEKAVADMSLDDIKALRKQFISVIDGAISNLENGVEIDSAKTFSKDNELSVKQQLIKYSSVLSHDDIVSTIRTEEYNINFDSKSAIRKEAKKIFAEIYNKGGINRTDGTFVEFTDKLVNKGLNYLKTNAEAISLFSVPDVIKKGRVISGHDNHKARNYSTFTIAAPIKIDGRRCNVAVVVTVVDNGRNRYKVHRILMSDGSNLGLKYKNDAEQGTYGIRKNTPLTNSASLVEEKTSTDIIRKKDENVKKSLDVDTDGNKLSAEQQEYFVDSKIRDEDGIYMAVDPAFGGGDFVSSPVGVQYGEDIYIPDVVFDNRDKQFTQPALARLAIRNAVKRMQIEANKSTEAYKEGGQTEVKKQGERITITSKAAPTELNGEVVDIGVAVIIGRKNRVHSVRVLTPQGNEFELIKNNDAEPLTNVGGTTKSGVSTTIGSASINNIPQNAEKSNTKKSLDVDTDGNTLTEAQQEYFKDSKVRDENGDLK